MLFSFATRAGSPQQYIPITVHMHIFLAYPQEQGHHPVNFPWERKVPKKTPRLSAERLLYSFHMRTGFISTLLGIKLGTLEVIGEWSDHYTTEFPYYFLW